MPPAPSSTPPQPLPPPSPPSAPLIALQNVSRRFATGTLALQDASLHVGAHEVVSLLGPSGCGKSSVLRLIAGLDLPTAGTVAAPALHGKAAADTAFVFQEPTLMPWASVFDNVWLPLRLAGVSRAQAAPRIRETLQAVTLSEFEAAFPAELSGGMQMRTSIARALVTRPRVLLMDEPFAALDEITRHQLNGELLHWWHARRPMALLFVTHSVSEAVFLSQRVLVMAARPGRVTAEVAIGEPFPRSAAFRRSASFVRHCTALTDALLQAHATATPATGDRNGAMA